jgi:cyclic di-GMP phosphodiesterase
MMRGTPKVRRRQTAEASEHVAGAGPMTGVSPSSSSLAPKRILIVDDDGQIRAVLARMLQSHHYVCDLAEDAAHARELLGQLRPDLVLSDVRMPGESGLDLLRHIRDRYPRLPVVMISGVGEVDVAFSALDVGAYGWVTKPFDASQVLIAVSNALIRAGLEERTRAYERHLEQIVIERTHELEATVEQLEHSQDELQHATRDTIEALTRAIERRDIETGQHTERVSRYATILAEAYGLPADTCSMIRAAVPMHDVGKVGVPDGILLKPGPVSSAEYTVIKQHVSLGHEILSRSTQPLLTMAAEIAETHHERWDGQGYLRGLRGEDIPLTGRITAIADAFDAMVSPRVYKPAIPPDAAWQAIKDGAGGQFDPDLADLFVEHEAQVQQVMAQVPDGE